MAKRLQAMNVNGYENGFSLSIIPERLSEPLNRKKPTMYFVNSMSELFHEGIDDDFIGQVFWFFPVFMLFVTYNIPCV